MRIRPVLGSAAIVLALAACSTASQTTPGSAYGATSTPAPANAAGGAPMRKAAILSIKKTKIGDVLTNASGQTLYWYSKDVRGAKSVCTGGCLSSWPAVTGYPVVKSGLKLNGKLGTITRPGGEVQVTYNGYPLYTYAGDTAPGQTTGNGAGGVWHVITGKVLTSAASAASTSAQASGGYGY